MIGWQEVAKIIGLPLSVSGFTILGGLIAKASGSDPLSGVIGGCATGLGVALLFLAISQEIHDICGRK